MSQAWHAAALPLQKTFPTLSELLGDSKPQEQQTPEQMLSAMQAWVSATRH
ncbi:hypothetical protein NUH86_10990 [Sphingobium sp. JS3065]|uniref:hypothetical protein n=1 Tax=Sphingobium sp. JS3065 TaxID=2970925 RepID=UPI00226489F4|nr:hypothetical protein [Sphingobium sp. JS3065]UZW54060.1 hypothetical protein NUH86_10990 [Sphingobium sp. JS3065]